MGSDLPVGDATGRQRAVDAWLRLAGLLALLFGLTNATHPGRTGQHLTALVLTLTAGLAWTGWLIGRHRQNILLSAASLVVLSASGGALMILSPVGVAVVALAGLSAISVLDTVPATVVAAVGPAAAAIAVAVTGHPAGVVLGATTGALAGLAIGLTRRGQLARVEHSAQLALAEERTHIEHDRVEVLAERTRLAREVHDVLAHTLSALSVQMEALDSLLDDDAPDPALVQGTVRRSRGLVVDGLDEARRAVAVLRDEPVALAEQVQSLAATDGATLTVLGTTRVLAPAASMALIRVTQEALTNARKHAPGAQVSITLRFDDDRVTVVVDNTRARADRVAPVSGGYGLRGMRERVELVGGSVSAGPTTTGWRVQAEVAA